ncbi:MAG: (Fe-S)-binding protein [Gemmatimonadota bacterium]|nr:4Fe-4S dicluster domain-containing protein [Gemmatimonadota bacterium]
MDGALVLQSVAILGGVGLTFGALIALAHKKLSVWEDPRIDSLTELLPGANCGACGFAGCRAFAESLVGGAAVPAGCTVMGSADVDEVASFLGVAAGAADRRIARLLCAGGSDVARRKADYYGLASCAAARAVTGGGKACAWGCIGLGDCAVACDFDAIGMTAFDLPAVDPDRCTACGDCVEACPLDLFVLLPLDRHLLVQCRNLLEGDAATSVCSVACNACGRCVQDAAPGLIEIRSGLAVIDETAIAQENPDATARCPTGAITWVMGRQAFPGSEPRLDEAVA